MNIDSKSAFMTAIKHLNIDTEFVLIKPNWINDKEGEYTDSEILGWLLEALPNSKKIVIESYTPWRGLIYKPENISDDLKVDLEGGKKYREFYRSMDEDFLERTGIGDVLNKFSTEYINITDCVWDNCCVPSANIIQEVKLIGYSFTNPTFAGYLPSRLYELREKATLVSLTKIKSEFHNPNVGFSGTIKNIFGLIPDPSRFKYHTDQDMMGLDTALADIFLIYAILFRKSRWIAEGIFNFTKEPFSPRPTIMRNQNLMYLSENPLIVDANICEFLGIDPESSDYYRYIKNITINLKLF